MTTHLPRIDELDEEDLLAYIQDLEHDLALVRAALAKKQEPLVPSDPMR